MASKTRACALRRGVRGWLSLLVALAVGSPGCERDAAVEDVDASRPPPDAAPLPPEQDVDAEAAPRRVLFVGNSYTFVNDLPAVVGALGAATDGAALEVSSVTVGAATLESLWTEGVAPARIASEHFDVVVLQGNSMEAFGTADTFYPYAHRFADAARDAGSRVVWYATWARRADDVFYRIGIKAPDFMMRSIDHAYRTAAERWGGTVARTGAAWQLALAEHPDIELHADDGSHPSPSGTLLAACTLLFAITGREATLVDPIPLGIERASATALCGLVPRVACERGGCGCGRAAQATTSYEALRGLSPTCDGVTERRGLACNAAMSGWCASKTCMNAGFGHASTADEVDLTCVAGTPLTSTFTALRALEPACDGSAERYGPHCATAIDRACRATGAVAGFGPTAADGDEVTGACVQAPDAARQRLVLKGISGMDPSGKCDGVAERWGDDCDIAISRYCRWQGFAGGFGPVEIAEPKDGGAPNVPVLDAGAPTGPTADIVCVGW